MPASFLEALFGMHVDSSGFEAGLKKAEDLAEQTTKNIAGKFGLMSAGIATAIAGAVIVSLEKAIKTTAEYGLEMEHLGNRLGMTSQQAATLTGVLERQGVSTGVAARSFQILAMQAKQTQEALDPFSTRLGKVLGTLRDSSGQLLNTSQVFDLARQKIQGAGTATQQLQEAQQIFGTRMGGQLLPILKLSNEEFERQRAAVEKSLGPVQEAADAALAYKQASTALEQSFKGIELELGTKLLPTLTQWITEMQGGLSTLKDWVNSSTVLKASVQALGDALTLKPARDGLESITYGWLRAKEALGLVDKGTADAFAHMKEYEGAHMKAATEAERKALAEKDAEAATTAIQDENEKRETQLVRIADQRVKLQEKLQSMGQGTQAETDLAVEQKLLQLEKERAALQGRLDQETDTDQRSQMEEKLLANRMASLDVVASKIKLQYKDEEAMLRANGALNLSSEIELLQKKLADENIVGNERLKIEGDIYEKRKQYLEESVKLSVQMGVMSVDQEIAYRKGKAAELLGKGDVIGAGQEIVKARDLSLQQFDQQIDFTKKLHIVSLQSEIDFQRQKLEVVKGNAQEEMKVISQIADLDKQMYNQRLEYALNYVTTTTSEYDKLVKAQSAGGEILSAGERQREAERKEVEGGRLAGEVLHGGGTEAQWQASQSWAQQQMKTAESLMQMGKELSDAQKDNVQTARDIMKAASGGEEVRAPGGPSPEVGSILSPIEGLATQGLARGSDIPRLDTSFTDLATRLRDVLNTNVSNLINFGTAVGDAAKKISAITGVPLNPGAVAPGGNIVSAGSSQQSPPLGGGTATVSGPPTVAPGNTPTAATPQTGVGPSSGNDDIVNAIKALGDRIDGISSTLSDAQKNSADQINEAIAAIQSTKQNVAVTVGVDPNSGDILTTSRLLDQLS